ncbi:MAG TPA: FAD-dependent oxidoreductase [Verrucomicrobiae bacterium]|nr:FAD-dependent oxidoreductase [Verrucomicrobiae bacterium]
MKTIQTHAPQPGCGNLLRLSLAVAALGIVPGKSPATDAPPPERHSDVVVVGATPGGVAAAVAAARGGASVILLEELGHVGGIVSGGLTNADIRKKAAVGGLFAEFARRVRDHYAKTYGADSAQVKVCQGGHMVEPKIAERIYREMLSGEKGIRLIERHRVVAARVAGTDGIERDATSGKRIDGAPPKDFGPTTRLVGIVTEDLTRPGSRVEFRAKAFIDATYEGDLAALAGVPYRVGRESRATFGEPHAGKIYVRFGDRHPLPGSTGEADDGIQAFCFRFHMTKDQANSVPVEKPPGYNRDDYRHLLADITAGKVTQLRHAIQLYPMPNGNFEANSDHPHPDTGVPSESLDLAEENWGWPEAGPEERASIFERYWNHNEGLIWFLQHDEAVPAGLREEALLWGFPKNEFADNRHRPHHIYVRQGRRIWGEYTFTERDTDPEHATGLPRRKPDGIAVAEYAIDCHGVTKYDPAHPGVREGYFYIDFQPTQLPYRILVPKCVEGLLVPVACSASHVGYQPIRMEPVFMALGEAAGIAAKIAQNAGVKVRAVNVPDVQREILRRGGVVLYECQPMRPEGL